MAKTPSTALRLVVVAVVGALAVGSAAAVFVFAGGDSGSAPKRPIRAQCAGLEAARARACYTRAFTDDGRGRRTTRGRRWRRSPTRPGGRAASCSRTATGSCTRSGAPMPREAGVSLSTLMDYLPRSNDPGCTAGFAHGLVTGVAPDIDPRQPGSGGDGVRGRRHALPALQLHPRLRARLHAHPRRSARARRSASVAGSGRRRRPTAPRAPTTTTGSRSSAPTTRRCRTRP